MAVAYAQAYNDTADVMAVKSFIVNSLGYMLTKRLTKYLRQLFQLGLYSTLHGKLNVQCSLLRKDTFILKNDLKKFLSRFVNSIPEWRVA
jgi:hypothetical protein